MPPYTFLLGAVQTSRMETSLGGSVSALLWTLCVLSWTKPAPFQLWCVHGGATVGDLIGTFHTGHDMAKAGSGAVGTQEKPPSPCLCRIKLGMHAPSRGPSKYSTQLPCTCYGHDQKLLNPVLALETLD